MSNDTPTEPVRPASAGPDPTPTAPPAVPPADEQVAEKRSFRDRFRRVGSDGTGRTFGLAALIASTLAALIVGGFAGAAIHAGSDGVGGDRGDRGDRMSDRMGERHGPGEPGDRHR